MEVKKNGASIAQFVYDGDGRQVKATMSGATTLYAGAHYEVSGGNATKYYFAGASRIAMRMVTDNPTPVQLATSTPTSGQPATPTATPTPTARPALTLTPIGGGGGGIIIDPTPGSPSSMLPPTSQLACQSSPYNAPLTSSQTAPVKFSQSAPLCTGG